LLAVFPLYLFAATSAAGFMESRYRAPAEFAMVILAVRGWKVAALARDAVTREIASQFLRFAAVGIAGFVVDVSVLYLGLALGIGPYIGRAISYLAAASTTWYLNRRITFADRRSDVPGTEWVKFVLLNGVGGLINYATYVLFLQYAGPSGVAPAVGVALGSLAGLLANFALSRQIVFRKASPRAADSAQ
ncbi:MAG: GtrA family protein, partial [Steroidobacteraceae bacterium]